VLNVNEDSVSARTVTFPIVKPFKFVEILIQKIKKIN